MEHVIFEASACGVAVIGAGHAGLEAALASARMGVDTVLFTLSLESLGNMPCNPSIGGTGKGHLVFEIDALGGEMGKAADRNALQSRMLNLGKGPAVHSLRQQSDRRAYHHYMKVVCENTKNLRLIQAEICSIEPCEDKYRVITRFGGAYTCENVIVCAGTYLNSNIVVGAVSYSAGPDHSYPACFLTDSMKKMGIAFRRFKTGTPARIHADSIHYELCEVQEGDADPVCFSDETDQTFFLKNGQKRCYVVYTNERTHEIIRSNIHRSPLYAGAIKSTGPRYCPSIEDKVMRFPDKERHQLFLEPMGQDTKEIYVQGLSSSLPEDVQNQVIHSIKGLEDALVMRTAYAIEYDCIDPTQLRPTLEFKEYPGLFGAGQFNGTSGYEEAACQGLIAGINAALRALKKEPLVLTRESSYIGTLIDDLVTKGTNEPYRMMTSRCEYRLLLRQDNADRRLTELGKKVGLINDKRYREKMEKVAAVDAEIERAESTYFSPSEELNRLLVSLDSQPVSCGVKLADLLRRPGLSYASLSKIDSNRPNLSEEVLNEAEIEIKYAGYIKRQKAQAEQFRKLESKPLPQDLDYNAITGLRLEARQKLSQIRPENIGRASRISGVSPADISVLLIYLNMNER